MKHAEAAPLPAIARQFLDPKIQKLVGICRVLQQAAGPGRAFYMSCGVAGQLVGVNDSKKAWRWLKLLRARGVLEQVSNGIPGPESETASEWKYLGG
ncbi:MAG TPA: hypothetical protein VKE94_22150 [Gemmataceae bacterium]|nr:hypothetical protein [Gemmataceae bacterium]